MKTVDVAGRYGLTFRQLDYWARRGYIHIPQSGSGTPRHVDDAEIAVIALMKQLTDAGFAPAPAARIARRYTNADPHLTTLKLTPHITLTVERTTP